MTIDHEQRRLHAVGGPEEVRRTFETALFEVKRVIVGQEEMLERVFVALLADGHILLEGVPGLAKTMTIKATSDVLGGSFKRIQFTPDLVPSDLVGTRIYRADRHSFETELGPVLLQLPARRRDQPRAREGAVGAARGDAGAPGHDRARRRSSRRTRSWCSRRRTRSSPRARIPLPEAQVDRFMFKVVVDYPSENEEVAVVNRSLGGAPDIEQVLSPERLVARAARHAGGVRGPRRERIRGRRWSRPRATPASTASTRSPPTSSTARARADRST